MYVALCLERGDIDGVSFEDFKGDYRDLCFVGIESGKIWGRWGSELCWVLLN